MYSRHIKSLRAKKGWTQADLARESGIPLDTIRRMEGDRSPKSEPAIVTLIRMGLDVDEEKGGERKKR